MFGQGETRARILRIVERYPGLHLREIQRRAGCSAMLAEYHLNILQDLDLVTSSTHGRFRDFFPATGDAGDLDARERRWLALLRRPPILALTLLLLERQRMRLAEISSALEVAPSTASYQVKIMNEAGLVDADVMGGRRMLGLVDPAAVNRLIRSYHPTPDLVTRFAASLSRALRRSLPGHDDGPADLDTDDVVTPETRFLPRGAQRVYRCMISGPLTQKQIRDRTDMPRRTVYDALRRLEEEGLIQALPHFRDTRQRRFQAIGPTAKEGEPGPPHENDGSG